MRKLAISIIAAPSFDELTAHTCTSQVWLVADFLRIVCEWALLTFCAGVSFMELAHLRLDKLLDDLGSHAITHHCGVWRLAQPGALESNPPLCDG